MTASARASWRERGSALALAAIVAVSTLVSGTPFVWCEPMQHAQVRSCCPHEAPHREATLSPSCCEARHMATLERSTPHAFPTTAVLPPALVAVVPLEQALAAAFLDAGAMRSARGGARAPPSQRVHRRVSVFLI